ncbi:LCCL domain-containing protein [Exophiala viscosa]|uniref:LCCL domain-containing protein n=1 Tax=Exophiala viscosa TaxID=2486360 RepID=UPI002199B52A|nr:LCCL domain-containing protein [Exophiala viscosa]
MKAGNLIPYWLQAPEKEVADQAEVTTMALLNHRHVFALLHHVVLLATKSHSFLNTICANILSSPTVPQDPAMVAPGYRDDDEENQVPADLHALHDQELDDEDEENGLLQIQSAPDPPNRTLPIPVWLRESASSFKYRWVPLPVRKASRAVVDWVKGPLPPRVLKIEPIFPKIQQAPISLLDKYAPNRKQRIILLVTLYAAWFLTWSLMLKHHSTAGFIKGYGRPENVWCGASFWNEGNGCGLNGNQCRPFSSAHMAFRCPANCKSTHLLEERIVGNQSLRYQGLVVGGPRLEDPESIPIYRGDSFICQAAIHAGIVTDADGGCGVATLTGFHTNFEASESNGIKSTAFPGTFPRSFTFQHLSSSQAQCPTDSRWPLFVVTAVALVLLSVFTTSPAIFFFSTFVIMFLHVGLVSDPPNTANVYEAISKLVERFLPAAYISFILYRYCARSLLTGLTAQIEKTILYLGFCFIGALNNYTFAPLIPIERLTPHDMEQPGAPLALAIIVAIVLAIIISQIHFIRVSGNMPRYLAIYTTMALGLIILLILPGERLRIHHYILALLFIPGTAFQIRPSLMYQGLLLGLFINGVARWGFASIIQTPAALGETGSGSDGSGSWWGAKSPNVTAVVGPYGSNITFNWGQLPKDTDVDGVSMLINDVERWRGYTDEELYWDQEEVTIQRRKQDDDGMPEFFRHVQ